MIVRHAAAKTSALAAMMFVAVGAAQAQDALPAGFKSQPVLKTGQTRDNDPIVYPSGKPLIISVIGTLEPGGRTSLHQHPVPTYVYILEGEVELRTEGQKPHRYKAGEAYIESLNRTHQVFNIGKGPVRYLVVFVGEEGTPTTVTPKTASN
jgi:quercetin dioxygenase-like cupin family protein